MKVNLVWSALAVSFTLLLLSDIVTSMYLDKAIDLERRDPESMPLDAYLDENEAIKDGDDLSDYAHHLRPQKRYLCRKYFIYNPVTGACMPSLMALRTMRTKSTRSFPNPQAWAKMWP